MRVVCVVVVVGIVVVHMRVVVVVLVVVEVVAVVLGMLVVVPVPEANLRAKDLAYPSPLHPQTNLDLHSYSADYSNLP